MNMPFFGLLDLGLYLQFGVFLIAAFFSWFIPGWLAVTFSGIRTVSLRFLLALPVGLSLWGVQGFVFGYLDLRVLTYVYLLLAAAVFFRWQYAQRFQEWKLLWKETRKIPVWLIILIAVGAFIQIFGHAVSGFMTDSGLSFYFSNWADGIMHTGYIQELVRAFPPGEPGAAGLPLVNYHFWSDLVQADLVRIWHIPVGHLFFQYAPILLSLWTMMLVSHLITYFGGNRKAVVIALFLLTFGGDAAYIVTLILHGIGADKVSSLDSGVSFYFNIPQVYARFVLLGVVLLLSEWWKKKLFPVGVLACFLIASLFGFKIYYALYAVFGFCAVIGADFLIQFFSTVRKNPLLLTIQKTLVSHVHSFVLVALLALLSLAVYLPVNKGAGGLTYSFFEWPHLLLSLDNINYQDWFLRMQVYEAAGNLRNIFILNVLAVLITFISIYGTRMLGMIPLFVPKNSVFQKLFWFFIPGNILFIVLGLFTLQTSGGLNIFNFLIVPIFSFNLFAALSLSRLPKKLFIPACILFVAMTLPRSATQFKMYVDRFVSQKADLVITHKQLEAYEFIRNSTPLDSVVQIVPSEKNNYISPYIAYLTERDTYIGGVEILKSHNQPTAERLEQLKTAFSHQEVDQKNKALADLGITYLLVPTSELVSYGYGSTEFAFTNEEMTVLLLSE